MRHDDSKSTPRRRRWRAPLLVVGGVVVGVLFSAVLDDDRPDDSSTTTTVPTAASLDLATSSTSPSDGVPATSPEPDVTASTTIPIDYDPTEFLTVGNALPDRSDEQFGEGAFRISCRGSHLNYDDPIIFPGQPGKSHLHQYFGNDAIDAFTTPDNIEATGASTCHGGPINRSGYWVPALIDGASDSVIPIDIVVVYYKGEPAEHSSPLLDDVSPLPEGLTMVSDEYEWSCGDDEIAAGCTSLDLTISFGQCWNGELDSDDHRSHVVFADRDDGDTGQIFCPDSHPTVIPRITYNIKYEVAGLSDSANWYLASDRDPAMAGRTGQDVRARPGSTAHGDYFEGWGVVDEATGTTADLVWWRECLIGFRNSSSGQLCDGRKLTWPASETEPSLVPVPQNPDET